ncbi:beta-ketoacyl synthase N-terminal-like domain-containing protein [Streptomyces sp. SL13]|uniref:Beta-ketoacyl synthase N-terminal-like domain-containing protein n=1 Tax=Streptantibioticus silvisoli TaxID=2705255 RepID=A0AA90HAS1_9ACTN|nr:beta-ketoacyl synthase N-terminal-like domain-containing protein [Streptantibioticus silvisoli]MDI5974470.1 beta-ketoacyl synthase N-terminal-like domain-containing protein [Streptantibioticus silvisoli]
MTEPVSDAAVAIVGMAGRFPGATGVEELWRNLRAGKGGLREITEAELAAAGVDPALRADPAYVRVGGPVAGLDLLDAAAFGFGPREAATTEPHHRLLLECSWEALEHAGYCPTDPGATVGVFAGAAFPDYLIDNVPGLAREPGGKQLMAAGIERDSLTSLVSYKLGLRGPSTTVQTFCSTSLVAVHLACQSLLTYECDMALAGGAALPLPQPAGYRYEEGGILSPDGRVRSLDADANGTVMGSGVAIVTLKRLTDAMADGDHVHAVIIGSAVDNDGADRAGYGAPGVVGQTEVIETALAVAGVKPQSVGYVECHAVGTPLGDSIELAALSRAFGTRRDGRCVLGSVKPSIGHLDRAAGVTGLLSAALSLRDRTLPAVPGFRTPNPALAAAADTFTVLPEDRPWPAGPEPRRAGVSSFGVGGTNAHVVLEEAPPRPPRPAGAGPHLLTFSAGDPAALADTTRRLRDHLARHPDEDLADVAYTLQVSRGRFGLRRAVVCRDHADALAALADPDRWIDGETRRRDPRVRLVAGDAVPDAWWPELAAATRRLLAPDPEAAGADPGGRAGALAGLAAVLTRLGVRLADDTGPAGTPGGEELLVAPDAGPADGWLLGALARLWQAGAVIDWPALHRGRGRRVPLPTYPFQRRRHWIDAPDPAAPAPRAGARGAAGDRLHGPVWRQHPQPVAGLDQRLRLAGPWLVFAAEDSAEALADRLVHAGAEVAVVRPGPALAADDFGDFTVRPAEPGDPAALLRSLTTAPRTIVHGFSLASPPGAGVAHFDAEQDRGLRSATALLRALADSDLPPAELVLLTRGAVGVLGPDLTHPEHAALAAAVPVPGFGGALGGLRHIDTDPGTGGDADTDQVLAGAVDPRAGRRAVRSGATWLLGHEPHPPADPDAGPPQLLPDDVVLITGGLHGGGLAVARHLASAYGCRLVLTTPTALPPRDRSGPGPDDRRTPDVLDLESRGATVVTVPVATGDGAGLREAVRAATDAFGRLDLVVHTVEPGEADDCAAVVRGFHALQAALGDRAIRRVALHPTGSGPAAAALEAYARVARLRGDGVWTVVHADLAGAEAAEPDGTGTDLAGRVLAAADPAHATVFTRPPGEDPAPRTVDRPARDAVDGGASGHRDRSALATPFVEPAEGVEATVAGLLAAALDLTGIGADDNFFELGGHSATAVHLAARLADVFGVPLPVTALVEDPTVRLLGARIAGLTG